MEAIKYSSGSLSIINQLLLPRKLEYIDIHNCNDAWNAIRSMQVRGAPAIAIVGGLSLLLELQSSNFDSCEQISSFVVEKMNHLLSARPTATNLANLNKRLQICLDEGKVENWVPETLKNRIIYDVERCWLDDISYNRSIGGHGCDALVKMFSGKMNILTHCNTGTLATSGYGTALGIVRKLHENGLLEQCYFTETRPYNQGSRLTAYELKFENIPSTLICDSMVAALMAQKKISAVVTGADCVAANGDTANKIGTYQIAVVAKYHSIPFFVAAPTSSINLNIENGSSIIVEERPPEEITSICGIQISVDGVKCWNPSFDVTPHQLITGIITEHGVFDVFSLAENIRSLSSN